MIDSLLDEDEAEILKPVRCDGCKEVYDAAEGGCPNCIFCPCGEFSHPQSKEGQCDHCELEGWQAELAVRGKGNAYHPDEVTEAEVQVKLWTEWAKQ